MFKRFEKTIEAINIYYLLSLMAFCLLALALEILSFIYDILLLGFMLNGNLEIKNVIYSLILIIMTGFLSQFLLNAFIRKRKISKNVQATKFIDGSRNRARD